MCFHDSYMDYYSAKEITEPIYISGTDPCDAIVCVHGGTCSVVNSQSVCTCTEGFRGEVCETGLYIGSTLYVTL